MKQIIITAVLVFIGFIVLTYTADAAKKLIKAEDVASVGIGADAVTVSKVVDGNVTCYVSRHGKFGAHALSCVK